MLYLVRYVFLITLFVPFFFTIRFLYFNANFQIRCISLLLPLRLGSHTGRSVLIGFIIVHLAAGPLANILNNLKECVRVIVCQMSTTFSLLSTKYDIMFKPLRQAFLQARVIKQWWYLCKTPSKRFHRRRYKQNTMHQYYCEREKMRLIHN